MERLTGKDILHGQGELLANIANKAMEGTSARIGDVLERIDDMVNIAAVEKITENQIVDAKSDLEHAVFEAVVYTLKKSFDAGLVKGVLVASAPELAIARQKRGGKL